MKTTKAIFAISLFLGVWSQVAFGWGNATHTYFAARLGAKQGHQNLNELYGAVLPDAFNFVFDANGTYLADQTHHNPLAFVRNSWRCEIKSAAYGFAGHNDNWGADFTAHHKGATTPSKGWIILKGQRLAVSLEPAIGTILTDAGVPADVAAALAHGVAPELGHDLMETSVDVLVRRHEDPQVGAQMLAAAQNRPPDVPLVLAAAYAKGLTAFSAMPFSDAVKFIAGAESEYRKFCLQYGGIFSMEDTKALETLAGQNAIIAETFLNALLAQNGIPIIVTVKPETVLQFMNSGIALAQQSPAYGPELAATLKQVDRELKDHHVSTCSTPFALWKEGESVPEQLNVPETYSLGQNYPNPFNPSTAICYALPENAYVSLRVYNCLGQEVATLVDGQLTAGQHQVTWDARNLASGVYICRIEARPGEGSGSGPFTETKRMVLVK